MVLGLRVPQANRRTPLFMDQALAAMHQANPTRLPLRLLIADQGGTVGQFFRCPARLQPVVESQLFAQYPDCALDRLPDNTFEISPDWSAWTSEVWLEPDLFPIRRYGQFEEGLERVFADPMASLLSAVASSSADVKVCVELVVRPAARRRLARAKTCLTRLARPFFRTHPRLASYYARWYLSASASKRALARLLGMFARPEVEAQQAQDPLATSTGRVHERELDLQAAADKLGRFCFEARLRLTILARPDQQVLVRGRLAELAGVIGQFGLPRLASLRPQRIRKHRPGRAPANLPWFLLSTEEVATLWHPPTAAVQSARVARVDSRQLEPPAALPRPATNSEAADLGVTVFRGRREPFGVLPEDRLKHTLVLGRTGMGKTTLIEQLALADIRAARGLAWIDPHGDATETLLRSIPRSRTNDVILLDASDRAFPLAFNPLDCPHPDQRALVASGIVAALRRMFADSFGPRLQYILTNALLALTEIPQATLVLLPRLLADERFRRTIVHRVSDPAVRAFFEQEFEPMPARFRAEAISPIQNKIGAYLSHHLLRNILGQSRSALHLRSAMDSSKLLLVNLSTGRIGEDASTLLGSLLITSLQVAALARADQPEQQRREFHIFVDEAHRYTASAFSSLLAEARKYRVGLCLASQALAQFDEHTRSAILGNVGSVVAFSLGPHDATALAEYFGSGLTAEDLTLLPKYRAYARLSVDGRPSRPFSLETLPLIQAADCQHPDVVRQTSRHRYARPIVNVEAEIRQAYAERHP